MTYRQAHISLRYKRQEYVLQAEYTCYLVALYSWHHALLIMINPVHICTTYIRHHAGHVRNDVKGKHTFHVLGLMIHTPCVLCDSLHSESTNKYTSSLCRRASKVDVMLGLYHTCGTSIEMC